MLIAAFPDGVSGKTYVALLAVLAEHMSHRNLASLMAVITDQEYAIVLNDIYRVKSIDAPPVAAMKQIQERLVPHGYQAWLEEN